MQGASESMLIGSPSGPSQTQSPFLPSYLMGDSSALTQSVRNSYSAKRILHYYLCYLLLYVLNIEYDAVLNVCGNTDWNCRKMNCMLICILYEMNITERCIQKRLPEGDCCLSV